MIEKSEKEVILISPYINIWGHLTQTIETAIDKEVNIELYYRANDNDKSSVDYELDKSLRKLEKLGVKVYDIPNLHTKLYLSEKSAIMSSMNLYEHSSKENEEIGLYTEDEILLKQFKSYSSDLIKRSYDYTLKDKILNKIDDWLYEDENEGSCIRCESIIEQNLKRPLCLDCFNEWKKFKNYDYEEQYCHKCSTQSKTTIKKPLCNECKDSFEEAFGALNKYTLGM